jgi:hypothetical protein
MQQQHPDARITPDPLGPYMELALGRSNLHHPDIRHLRAGKTKQYKQG